MKIDGYSGILDALRAYNSQKKPQVSRGREIAPADRADTLEISDQAREIQEIQSELKDLKEVRQDKVDRFKREIESGAYRVDARKVADAMLAERILDKEV